MLALCLTACMVAPTPMPHRYGVQLDDAKTFNVSRERVRANYHEARYHVTDSMRFTIWQNNGPNESARWEVECAYRLKAWDLLDDVIYCSYSDGKKLDSLCRLRELIGDDDYFAGRMPAPIPMYRK